MIPLIIVISLFSIGTTCILIDMIINPDIPVITKPSSIVKPETNEEDVYPIDDIFFPSLITEQSEKNSQEEENPLLSGFGESNIFDDNDSPFDLQISGIDNDFESISDSLPINDDELIISDNLVIGDEVLIEKDDTSLNTIELDTNKIDSIILDDLEDSLCAPIDMDKKLMDYDLIFDDDSFNKDLELE